MFAAHLLSIGEEGMGRLSIGNCMSSSRVMLLSFIGAIAFSQSAAAKTIEADPSLVWQFSKYKDAAAKNADAAQLIYAIPETDAIVAAATCNAESAGKVTISLSANVVVPDKAKVSAKLFGQAMDGTALVPESGEGLSGFSVTVPANDALLAKLAAKPSLTYSFKGGPERTIPLSKGKVPIKKFIQACKSFASLKHATKTNQQ